MPQRSGPRLLARRLSTAGLAALVVPLLAVAWVAAVLPEADASGAPRSVLGYLRGIAPLPDPVPSEPATGEAVSRSPAGAGVPVASGWPWILIGLTLAGAALAARRHAPEVVFWTAWALPFLLYEIAIGENLDLGLYVPYVLPALAGLATVGVGALPGRSGVARLARYAAMLVLLTPTAAHTLEILRETEPRSAFFARPVLVACRFIREHAPPGAVVVEPPGVANANLIPAYARRRPIAFEGGRFRLFAGGRWAPLDGRSFVDVDRRILEDLLRQEVEVIALDPEPFRPGPGEPAPVWREIEEATPVLRAAGGRGLWRLEGFGVAGD
jgi:hypothetical protein